jgi:hypothetical protein
MRSNSSDIVVVDAADCGSGGGGSAQLRPDQCGGGVIRRRRPDQNGGDVDLAQGRSADVGEAS